MQTEVSFSATATSCKYLLWYGLSSRKDPDRIGVEVFAIIFNPVGALWLRCITKQTGIKLDPPLRHWIKKTAGSALQGFCSAPSGSGTWKSLLC